MAAIKKMACTMICMFICLFTMIDQGYANADKVVRCSTIALMASPKKFDGCIVEVEGYLKYGNGEMILYLDENSYQYDTKENAVCFPEREELSIEEFWEKVCDNNEWYEKPQNGEYISMLGIIQSNEESEYAAQALYRIGDKEEFYNQAREVAQRSVPYDEREEKKEAEKVSVYRLFGDPWRYDGKKICVEMRQGREGALRIQSIGEPPLGKMFIKGSVKGKHGEDIDPWESLINQFNKKAPYCDLSREKMNLCVQTALLFVDTKLEITTMFYLYEDSYMQYYYSPLDVQVHEKDIQKYKMGLYMAYLFYGG